MTRLLLLAAVLGVAGCSLNDCSFDVEKRLFGSEVRAETSAVGDTLTLAIVGADDQLQAFVPAGLTLAEPSSDGTVQIGYGGEAFVSTGSPSPRLAATARGDTVYVYVEGTLDPSLFAQVCSPPSEQIRVDLSFVSAPPGVRALRVSRIDANALPQATAQALRQRDAAHPARLLTV